MNIMNKLTLRHLRMNRSRTLITILGITLSVAMICAVAGFVLSLRDVLYRQIVETRGDHHIAIHGIAAGDAAEIAAADIFASSYTTEESGKQGLFLSLRNPWQYFGRSYHAALVEVFRDYEFKSIDFNSELLAMEGATGDGGVFTMALWIAGIALAVIMAGSIIVIANAFYISASDRVHQFGLLKSAGATGAQIRRCVRFEALTLTAAAIPLGILLGYLVQAVAFGATNKLLMEDLGLLNGTDLSFRIQFSPIVLLATALLALLTVSLSAWLPARRASRISAIDAIRRARDVKIKASSLKSSGFVRLLFGFEGTLAAKSMKRAKKSYRSSVVSLTTSIILFVSMSSLVTAINQGTQMQYDHDYDVWVKATMSMEDLDKTDEALLDYPDAKIKTRRFITMVTDTGEEFYTKEYLNILWADVFVSVASYPDEDFAKLAPISGEGVPGIIVNFSGRLNVNGVVYENITPYRFEKGAELRFMHNYDGRWSSDDAFTADLTVTLAAEMKTVPESMLFTNSFTLLIPDSAFRRAFAGRDVKAYYEVVTDDPDAFTAAVYKAAAHAGGDVIYVTNYAAEARMNRNIVQVIMLFGYGFIGMLSLIAVTSVISTISTGMALRRREFAMLYSVGMTPGGMNRMIRLESLISGLKSLLVGLPVGFGISWLIYRGISEAEVQLVYHPPIPSMLISTAAVLLLTFGTMHYGKTKMNKISIVEALRSEIA